MLLPNDVDFIANHAFLSNCVKFELKKKGVTVSATPKALSLHHETIQGDYIFGNYIPVVLLDKLTI